jgi:uncharacterized membrane protein YqjE
MRKTELFFTAFFLSLSGITVVFYITLPIVKYLISGDNKWELPFMVKLPFDYHFFPAYQIVFALVSYSLFVVIMVLAGTDGILFGLCLYLAGQFQIVEQKIKNLIVDFNEDDSKPFTFEENRKIKEKLVDIVQHHNQCIDLNEKVSQLFDFVLLTNFTSSSIVMAMCSLNIIVADGMDKLIFGSYLSAATIQMFAFCKNGSTLTDASARVAVAIYNFEWYKCDRQVKYSVLTILMRSQKTTELRVPFCHVSMETFANVSQ